MTVLCCSFLTVAMFAVYRGLPHSLTHSLTDGLTDCLTDSVTLPPVSLGLTA